MFQIACPLHRKVCSSRICRNGRNLLLGWWARLSPHRHPPPPSTPQPTNTLITPINAPLVVFPNPQGLLLVATSLRPGGRFPGRSEHVARPRGFVWQRMGGGPRGVFFLCGPTTPPRGTIPAAGFKDLFFLLSHVSNILSHRPSSRLLAAGGCPPPLKRLSRPRAPRSSSERSGTLSPPSDPGRVSPEPPPPWGLKTSLRWVGQPRLPSQPKDAVLKAPGYQTITGTEWISIPLLQPYWVFPFTPTPVDHTDPDPGVCRLHVRWVAQQRKL